MRLRLPARQSFDYQTLRNNYGWKDHILRTHLTASLLSWFEPVTVLDPACGDGSIVAAAHRIKPISAVRLADISMPNFYFVGTEMRPHLPPQMQVSCQTIEETLSEDRRYDVVVLTEILEHVEDPVSILRMARQRAKVLIASSPMFVDDSTLDDNAEHLWQFDVAGYGEMLVEAGWKDTVAFVPVNLPTFWYDFQIWGVT